MANQYTSGKYLLASQHTRKQSSSISSPSWDLKSGIYGSPSPGSHNDEGTVVYMYSREFFFIIPSTEVSRYWRVTWMTCWRVGWRVLVRSFWLDALVSKHRMCTTTEYLHTVMLCCHGDHSLSYSLHLCPSALGVLWFTLYMADTVLQENSTNLLSLIAIFLSAAGGLATYLHADSVGAYLPQNIKFRAIADAGYVCSQKSHRWISLMDLIRSRVYSAAVDAL